MIKINKHIISPKGVLSLTQGAALGTMEEHKSSPNGAKSNSLSEDISYCYKNDPTPLGLTNITPIPYHRATPYANDFAPLGLQN